MTNKKLTVSACVVALYVVLTTMLSPISFGFIQIRVANVVYGLPFLLPYTALPIGIAVAISNALGGLGLVDVVGGFAVGWLTGYISSKVPNTRWLLLTIPVTVGLLVPTWLSPLLGTQYAPLAIIIFLSHIPIALMSKAVVDLLEVVLGANIT